MSGLFGSKSQASQTPAVTGLQIQTSSYGKCLPVVYGKTRMAPNLIWYANFQQHGSGGGKGGGKGGVVGGCFAHDTYISTPDGSATEISKLVVGDLVTSYDPINDQIAIGVISETHQHLLSDTPDRFIWVKLESGIIICVTDNHYLLRLDGQKVEIGEYREGDVVMCQDGSLEEIVSILRDPPQDEYSYNLTVEPHHNYVANTVLVHNGGGGKKSQSTTYSADIMYAICEGPITDAPELWNDKTEQAPAAIGLSIIDGAYGQAPWSYLATTYPAQSLGYSGVALAVAQAFNLGQSANLPNINFEVEGVLFGNASNGIDANPSWVCADILTNDKYGVGFTERQVGTLNQQGELHTITAGTITVNNAAFFVSNLNVILFAGFSLTCVASSPAVNQYSFSNGVYTFNAAQNGTPVFISYTFWSSLDQYRNFAELMGLWISPAFTDQADANSVLSDIAKYTFSEWVWSSGVLTLVPRGRVAMTDGTHTYTPSAVLFDFNDDDYMDNQGSTGSSTTTDPVIVTRLRQSDQTNDIQVEFVDRGNQYATAIAEAVDQGLIDMFRRRFSGAQTAHMFSDINAANTSAQLLLQKEYVRNTYSVTLPQQYIILDPMDVVTLTDSYLGLDHKVVRVQEMTENDDGSISFLFEEIPDGTGSAAVYDFNQGQGYSPTFDTVPGDVNTPVIFDAPEALTGGVLQIWVAVSNSDPQYGGCNIWVSTDGTTYQLAGQQLGQANMGVTTNILPVGADPDVSHTLDVDLTESRGALISGTSTDADLGVTVCYLGSDNGGEFISYETATLSSAYNYAVGTYIRRGQYGSTDQSHASGTKFSRLDAGIFKFTYQSPMIGSTVHVKFTSFNTFGNGEQTLSGVTAYSHTISGLTTLTELSPASLTLTPVAFTHT